MGFPGVAEYSAISMTHQVCDGFSRGCIVIDQHSGTAGNGPVDGDDGHGALSNKRSKATAFGIGWHHQQSIGPLPHKHRELLQLNGWIVVADGDDEEGIVSPGHFFSSFGTTGKERVSNARDQQSNHFCAPATQHAGGMVRLVLKLSYGGFDLLEGCRADILAAIDDTRSGTEADPGSTSDIHESRLGVTFHRV